MKLATLALSTTLVVGQVLTSPAENVLTPSGIPATSGLPFSTLSFDTTANPSVLSAVSSLISSESTAVMPYSVTTSAHSGSVATAVSGGSATPTTTTPATVVTSTVVVSPTTGAASRLSLRSGGVHSEVLVGVGFILGAIAALY